MFLSMISLLVTICMKLHSAEAKAVPEKRKLINFLHPSLTSVAADTDIVSSALNLGPDASTEGVPIIEYSSLAL